MFKRRSLVTAKKINIFAPSTILLTKGVYTMTKVDYE